MLVLVAVVCAARVGAQVVTQGAVLDEAARELAAELAPFVRAVCGAACEPLFATPARCVAGAPGAPFVCDGYGRVTGLSLRQAPGAPTAVLARGALRRLAGTLLRVDLAGTPDEPLSVELVDDGDGVTGAGGASLVYAVTAYYVRGASFADLCDAIVAPGVQLPLTSIALIGAELGTFVQQRAPLAAMNTLVIESPTDSVLSVDTLRWMLGAPMQRSVQLRNVELPDSVGVPFMTTVAQYARVMLENVSGTGQLFTAQVAQDLYDLDLRNRVDEMAYGHVFASLISLVLTNFTSEMPYISAALARITCTNTKTPALRSASQMTLTSCPVPDDFFDEGAVPVTRLTLVDVDLDLAAAEARPTLGLQYLVARPTTATGVDAVFALATGNRQTLGTLEIAAVDVRDEILLPPLLLTRGNTVLRSLKLSGFRAQCVSVANVYYLTSLAIRCTTATWRSLGATWARVSSLTLSGIDSRDDAKGVASVVRNFRGAQLHLENSLNIVLAEVMRLRPSTGSLTITNSVLSLADLELDDATQVPFSVSTALNIDQTLLERSDRDLEALFKLAALLNARTVKLSGLRSFTGQPLTMPADVTFSSFVTSLDLSNSTLVGALPPLPLGLTYLNIALNFFTGEWPEATAWPQSVRCTVASPIAARGRRGADGSAGEMTSTNCFAAPSSTAHCSPSCPCTADLPYIEPCAMPATTTRARVRATPVVTAPTQQRAAGILGTPNGAPSTDGDSSTVAVAAGVAGAIVCVVGVVAAAVVLRRRQAAQSTPSTTDVATAPANADTGMASARAEPAEPAIYDRVTVAPPSTFIAASTARHTSNYDAVAFEQSARSGLAGATEYESPGAALNSGSSGSRGSKGGKRKKKKSRITSSPNEYGRPDLKPLEYVQLAGED